MIWVAQRKKYIAWNLSLILQVTLFPQPRPSHSSLTTQLLCRLPHLYSIYKQPFPAPPSPTTTAPQYHLAQSRYFAAGMICRSALSSMSTGCNQSICSCNDTTTPPIYFCTAGARVFQSCLCVLMILDVRNPPRDAATQLNCS